MYSQRPWLQTHTNFIVKDAKMMVNLGSFYELCARDVATRSDAPCLVLASRLHYHYGSIKEGSSGSLQELNGPGFQHPDCTKEICCRDA